MSRDFLTKQIRTNKIIGSGSNAQPDVIIYSDEEAQDNIGGTSSTLLDNVGSDVFLVVSGTIGGKESAIDNSVSLFKGDVVVSGTLYAEEGIQTPTFDSLWEPDLNDPNNLVPTNVIDGNTGCFALDFNMYLDNDNEIHQYSYTLTNRPDATDLYFELDQDGNITTKE